MNAVIFLLPFIAIALMIGAIIEAIPFIIIAIILAVVVRNGLDVIRPRHWWSGQVKDAIMVTVGLISLVGGPVAGLMVSAMALVYKAIQ